MCDEMSLEGTGPYAGRYCRTWYKNENHALWADDRLLATSLDIITVLHEDGRPP